MAIRRVAVPTALLARLRPSSLRLPRDLQAAIPGPRCLQSSLDLGRLAKPVAPSSAHPVLRPGSRQATLKGGLPVLRRGATSAHLAAGAARDDPPPLSTLAFYGDASQHFNWPHISWPHPQSLTPLFPSARFILGSVAACCAGVAQGLPPSRCLRH